ncbi:MAG: SRPBCC domain-containing protein [Acidobacteriota bacterium]|nr:SRPBCC domain-containing protein [Acidobacteriota bacterium]
MLIDLRQSYESPVLSNAFHVWVDISAPIEMIFRYLTQADELSSWWASKCTTEPKPGGRIHYIWDGEIIRTGDALFRQFEPPSKVVIEWTHGDGQPIARDGSDQRGLLWPPLNIFELAMIDANRTRLHLHDLGVLDGEAYEPLRKATGEGWRESMARLKRVVEARHSQELARRMRRRDKNVKADRSLE